MTGPWLSMLGISLALTLAIELCFAALRGKRGRALAFVALANVFTNPLVVVSTRIWGAPIAAMELFAVLAEGLLYQKSGADFPRPYRFSLCANALSFLLGAALNLLWK